MKNCFKSKKAITLIALVITIVVLLILAATALTLTLGENGILKRAKEAALMQKKAQYMEEINLAIADEKMERAGTAKSEPFITSVAERLTPEKKSWVKSIIKCAEENGALDEKENDEENNMLYITTKEDYELLVDIDNNLQKGTIRDSFAKAGVECIVTYDSNAGEDTITGTVENQSIKPGFSIVTQTNNFDRPGYEFIGWSRYQTGKDQDDQDSIYAEGAKLKITEDTTLYAIWEQSIVTVNFNNNGGTGTMSSIQVGNRVETNLPANTFTREGYTFSKWNTEADGSGTDFTTTIIINENVTLYAQWNKILQSDTGTTHLDLNKNWIAAVPTDNWLAQSYYYNTIWEGSGTEQDPYLIQTEEDLAGLAYNVDNGNEYNSKYFKLTNDLSMGKHIWVPIGGHDLYNKTNEYCRSNTKKFKGIFDGNDKTIYGLYYNQTNQTYGEYVGLFGYCNSASIKNTRVYDSYLKGYSKIGGINGSCDRLYLCNCCFDGIIEGSSTYCGGIVGYHYGRGSEIGMINCANFGDIKGYYDCGGLAGNWDRGTYIYNCFSTGNVTINYTGTGTTGLGGLLGSISSSNGWPAGVKNCYSTGNINCSGIPRGIYWEFIFNGGSSNYFIKYIFSKNINY